MRKLTKPGTDEIILDMDDLFPKLTDFQMEALEYEVHEEMLKRGYVYKKIRRTKDEDT